MMRGRLLLAVSLASLCLLPAPARADVYRDYGFQCITGDTTSTDAAIGEAQFSVRVSASGMDSPQVLFTFQNAGPDASSMTDIYFYDGVLGHSATLTPSAGVSFDEDATPENLPGLPEAGATRVFSADSNPAVQPSGINPEEWLEILFTLNTGTFGDVIAGLDRGIVNPMISGNITIGIRAQGFADEGSGSFLQVPVPGAVLLGVLGLGVAALKLRKRV